MEQLRIKQLMMCLYSQFVKLWTCESLDLWWEDFQSLAAVNMREFLLSDMEEYYTPVCQILRVSKPLYRGFTVLQEATQYSVSCRLRCVRHFVDDQVTCEHWKPELWLNRLRCVSHFLYREHWKPETHSAVKRYLNLLVKCRVDVVRIRPLNPHTKAEYVFFFGLVYCVWLWMSPDIAQWTVTKLRVCWNS